MLSVLVDSMVHALRSFNWHACTFQSHALALCVIYFAYYYPWGQQYDDTSLKPPKQVTKDSAPINTAPSSEASIVSNPSEDLSSSSEDDKALAEACPEATAAERKRFLTSTKGDVSGAIKTLQNYVEWNQKHVDIAKSHNITRPTMSNEEDINIWTEVCEIALKANEETGRSPLPRVIRMHYKADGKPLVDPKGYRIIQIMPALMDVTLASSSTYALGVALYLNALLDREGLERIVVCMDVRAGQGWPNTHAVRLVPFMQQTTTLLLSLFPERLSKCLLYPIPPAFSWVWKTISAVVEPTTRDKISLMSGPNKIVSPPPFEQMYEHMEKDAAHQLENARLSEFR